jgi:hypothetical protein
MTITSRITELSSTIAKNTAIVDNYFASKALPMPSLEVDALPELPIADDAAEVKKAKLAIIEACSELQELMMGPKELLNFKVRRFYGRHSSLTHTKWTAYVSVKIILRFKLDLSFAVGESTTFEAMSKYSGLSVMNVRRVVRHGILNHRFFQEKIAGVITHSALTAVLARDELVRNAMVVQIDEFWPAGVKAGCPSIYKI